MFVIPPAALHVADRLITALMTLVRAASHLTTSGSTPTLPEAAAQTLLFRLFRLVTHLIRISNFGVRTPTQPKPTTKADEQPAPIAPLRRPTRPIQILSLPRRAGWLLAALPEIAPAVAAEISTLLADPAIATLLDAAPTLHRTLRPLLRGLGLRLDAAPPIPTPPRPHRRAPIRPAPRRPASPLRPRTRASRRSPPPCRTRPTKHQALSRHVNCDIVTERPNGRW